MTNAENRVTLSVVSVLPLNDSLPSDDGLLPATYSVGLGLSRRITAYEYTEIVNSSPSLAGALRGIGNPNDGMWLTIPDTTIDEVHERLPQWLDLLSEAVVRAKAVQQAADSLADGQRAELERRRDKVTEVNRWLASLRDNPRT
ncbi:hypothetical protein [Mycobacterium intracellulare]|uniref:hypothetical protein n=1 Tax=Mycobacterium intracellulare TaxID=1767 RepID=UPI0013DE9E10|nr:hypothetical protein [Mycobacterium intracellulare]